MASVANPHKKFQFSIQVFGMNPMLAQKVTVPERDLDQIEHGEGNYKVKTAGMVNVGMLKVEKLFNAGLPDKLFWGWIYLIQNEYSGGGVIPDIYKKAVTITRLANNGITVLDTWVLSGVWPKKINEIELDRVSSDNTIESIEFSVDRVDKV